MDGEPVSGSYYHPSKRKQIYLNVGQKPRGLEGMKPWYATDYGPYVGIRYGWSPPRDWSEWVPYTGQMDCLMEAEINSIMARAKLNAPYEAPHHWWQFWRT